MPVKTKVPIVSANAPYLPPDLHQEVAWAIKAVAAGAADKGQQTLVMRWMIWELCEYYGMSYRPDSAGDTAFAEGKRFCGSQLVRAINLGAEQITRLPKLNVGGDDEEDAMQNM